MKFNPHCPTELGIGYSNGEVTVMSLENDPHSPKRIFPSTSSDDDSYTPMVQGGEITKVNTKLFFFKMKKRTKLILYDYITYTMWYTFYIYSYHGIHKYHTF